MRALKTLSTLVLVLSPMAFAQGRPPAPAPMAPPAPPAPPVAFMAGLGGAGLRAPGIPPEVAQRLGLSADTVKKVRDLGFDANEQLIPLEADLKRAQLELEKTLAQPNPDEGLVLSKVELVGRAELQVRKNRVGLMLRIRKLLGPETWDRLQAEVGTAMGPGANLMMLAPGPGTTMRREIRVIQDQDGTSNVTEVNQ